MAKSSNLLVPGALTMDKIVRKTRDGKIRIKHDGMFNELSRDAFKSRTFTPLTHRRWTAQPQTGIASEMAGFKLLSEQVGNSLAQKYLADAYEVELKKTVAEMITTAQGSMDLLEKVRIDVDFGLAEVPLLYEPIYERVPGPFPGGVVQLNENTLEANVVFLEKFEGGEIVFGTLAKGVPAYAPITAYAAGFEWTEDMIEFDRTWDITLNNRAFGRSYNHLLNHLHLSPIISFTYAGDNLTAANATGTTLQEKTLLTFQSAYSTAVLDTPQRTPSVILANEADRFKIEDALLTPVRDAQGNPLPRVPVDTIIYYNGATVVNGVKSFTYPGVTQGTCFFIFPKQRFKELVHHDLRIDIGPPDISRLIEGQQVGRTRRGLYADLAQSVQKITLPV
jgi:hypothetical protein